MSVEYSPEIAAGNWRITAMLLAPRTANPLPSVIQESLRSSATASGLRLSSPIAVDVIRPATGEYTISIQLEGAASGQIPQNLLGRSLLDTVALRYPGTTAYRSTATFSTLSPIVGLVSFLAPQSVRDRAWDRIVPRRVVTRVERATGAPLAPPLSTSVAGNLGIGLSSQRASTDPQRSGEVTAREAASGAAAAAAGVGEVGFPTWGYALVIGVSVLVVGVAVVAIRKAT